MDDRKQQATEWATLGGGCFWCLEAVFSDLRGVVSVKSGFAGGTTADPTYEQVCTGNTGHAEVVHIEFDPTVISFKQLLNVFFYIHNPTTLNRQGDDVGTQYRSVVFYHSERQERETREFMRELEQEGVWREPIVTEVTPFTRFFPAEAEHDDYFRRHPDQVYCRLVIAPKVDKFHKRFKDLLQPKSGE
ncbi:MAG TPA: peptide-methionine (S)-S-oxide reductase MsrA [Firmicutes bacterium]|nr:peptide-methionine (S)-S-oxide reductase MsrA [Bacillota bacterium]